MDEVSHRIVHACEHDTNDVIIRQAAVGAAQSPTVEQCWDSIQGYFNVHRVDQQPSGRYLGPRDAAFSLADTMRHRLPVVLARTKSRGQRRQAEKRSARIAYLNEQFSYFTTHTFDFQSAVPMDAAFDGAAFTETVNRGVYRHLFNRHDRTWMLAGRARAAWSADLQWARRQPRGSALLRGACWMASKVFRRSIGSLTVDVPSFERALAERPAGSSLVLTPSHRSYLDFVLCTYLAFARPDLLPIPHFAATTDFARIPILGRMLRSAHAFYLERGRGKDPELAGRVEGLLDQGHTLAFFVEGARSRDGEFLQPKRGLLRCLQGTGRTCTLLPIAISYERVPERAAFDRELAGLPKQPMRLGALLAWVMDAWRGRIDLGDIHIACGAPVILDSTSDVHTVSREVIARLRDAMIQDELPRDADDAADSKPWSAATAAPVMAGVHAAR